MIALIIEYLAQKTTKNWILYVYLCVLFILYQ